MNKRLYRLLMEYKDRELDDRFIDVAFDTIMSHEDEDMYRFVDDYMIDNEMKDYGNYNHNHQIITINREKIIHDKPVTRCYNDRVFALEVIKHEIEHARNIQRLYQYRNDIESTVLRYSLKDYCMTHGLLPFPEGESIESLIRILKKRENYIYVCDPDERIADIKAWKFIVNLLKNQRTSDDLLFARSMLYYAYIRGYQDNRYYLDAPTYSYLLNMGMLKEHYSLKRRVDRMDYCLDTRLLCGLPISKDEYDHGVLKKVRLQMREDNRRLERE